MSKYMQVNSDEDLSFQWSFSQGCISEAFSKGYIWIKIEDSNGTNSFKPVCLYFGSEGQIEILVNMNKSESEIANRQPTILIAAQKDVGQEPEHKS